MENSSGSVVNSLEVQIDNFLEHFKRTSKAMEERATEHDSPLVRGSASGSRPASMGVFENGNSPVAGETTMTEGYDCLHDADGLLLDANGAEGRFCYMYMELCCFYSCESSDNGLCINAVHARSCSAAAL